MVAKRVAKAFEIVNEIDYLPFSHKTDGCWGRAFYINLELITEGIPSHSLFVVSGKAGKLKPTGKQPINWYWRYHVAPIIRTGNRSPGVIIDPAMTLKKTATERKYWTLRGWLSQFVTDVDNSNPLIFIDDALKSPSKTIGDYYDSKIMPDIKSISKDTEIKDLTGTKLGIKDFEKNCNTLYDYLQKSGGTDKQLKKLQTRTVELMQKMDALGFLETPLSAVTKIEIKCGPAGLASQKLVIDPLEDGIKKAVKSNFDKSIAENSLIGLNAPDVDKEFIEKFYMMQ